MIRFGHSKGVGKISPKVGNMFTCQNRCCFYVFLKHIHDHIDQTCQNILIRQWKQVHQPSILRPPDRSMCALSMVERQASSIHHILAVSKALRETPIPGLLQNNGVLPKTTPKKLANLLKKQKNKPTQLSLTFASNGPRPKEAHRDAVAQPVEHTELQEAQHGAAVERKAHPWQKVMSFDGPKRTRFVGQSWLKWSPTKKYGLSFLKHRVETFSL